MGNMDLYSAKLTYRFLENGVNNENVEIPFGFGLSYSTFEYESMETADTVNPCDTIDVSVTVTNTGDFDADEVVQVYLQRKDLMGDETPAPNTRLVAFERIHLERGESKRVTLQVEPRWRSVVRESDDFWAPDVMLEEGPILLTIGGGPNGEFQAHTVTVDGEARLDEC